MRLSAKQFSGLFGAAIGFALLAFAQGATAAELVMFERSGCPWCIRWDKEVAPAYSKTAEGQRAPLRRYNIEQGQPKDFQLARPVRYTPTFVLVDAGRETGRITGYIDNGMFWGLLTELVAKLEPETGGSERTMRLQDAAAPTETKK